MGAGKTGTDIGIPVVIPLAGIKKAHWPAIGLRRVVGIMQVRRALTDAKALGVPAVFG